MTFWPPYVAYFIFHVITGVRVQTQTVEDLLACPELGSTFDSQASFFDAAAIKFGGVGACHPTKGENYMEDLMIGSMAAYSWNGGEVCGECIEVLNRANEKSVIVTIVDKCGECGSDGVSLSHEAFGNLTDGDYTTTPIDVTWRVVPCLVEDNVKYKFKGGSSEWWFGIQPVHTRFPVKRLEVRPLYDSPFYSDKWIDLVRDDNGFFMKPYWYPMKAPIAVRAISTNDQVVEDEIDEIKSDESQLITGAQQFIECQEFYPRIA